MVLLPKAVWGECNPCSITIHLYSLWPGHPYDLSLWPISARVYMSSGTCVYARWHCLALSPSCMSPLCPLAWPIQPHLPDDVLLGAIGRSPEPNCLLALTPLFGWRRSWVGGTKTFDKRQVSWSICFFTFWTFLVFPHRNLPFKGRVSLNFFILS